MKYLIMKNLMMMMLIYIEKEFNEFNVEDGYESLFNFPKFKEFVKINNNEAGLI